MGRQPSRWTASLSVAAAPPPASPGGLSQTQTLWLVGLLGAWPAFWSDMIFPALFSMQADLKVSASAAQQAVSLFFIANAVMCLVHGILIDAWGRRRMALVALGVLSVTSILCALATRIEHIWALRVMQGMVIGLGHILCRTIIRDLYSGVQAQHMIGQTSLLQTVVPIFLPVLAGWLTVQGDWRWVFWTLAAVALAALALYWYWLPETLPPARRRRVQPGTVAAQYRHVLLDGRFLRPTVAHGLNWSAMFLYVAAGPVFVQQWVGHAPTDVYLVFLPILLGLVAGLYLLPRWSRWLKGADPLPSCYAVLFVAHALNLLLAVRGHSGLVLLLPLGLCSLGIGLCMPVLIGRALQPHAERSGLAASLQMFVQYAFMAVTAGVLAPRLWDDLPGLALTSAAMSTLSLLLIRAEMRSRLVEASGA